MFCHQAASPVVKATVHTFFLNVSSPLLLLPIAVCRNNDANDIDILVYIGEPEAGAKICVYVFILMRVFLQIYF